MTKYVALLRGIGPMNPNMRNEKIAGVFKTLGFANVRTVGTTGNVLFESASRAVDKLEAAIEAALPAQLGFTSTTITRSQERLQRLVDEDPFEGFEDIPKSRLNVTFLKHPPRTQLKVPFRLENGSFELVRLFDQAICSTMDITQAHTPDLMGWLDKELGKHITTRTWNSVGKILRALNAS